MLAGSGLPSSVDDALSGAARALVESHRHFDVISERRILDDISQYRVVVLPDQAYLSDSAIEALDDYVRSGGSLLATHRTSLYRQDGSRRTNFGLAHVFGVDFHDTSRYSVSYVKSTLAGVPAMPILVKGVDSRTLLVSAGSEVDTLATVMDPALEAKPHRHVETSAWIVQIDSLWCLSTPLLRRLAAVEVPNECSIEWRNIHWYRPVPK